MIIIKNLRNEQPKEEWQVKVDRDSILGNPFRMSHESQRNNVCDMYALSFKNMLVSNDMQSKEIQEELKKLVRLYKKHGKLELFCWCSPKRCHAETIKDYLEKEIK